MDFNARLDELRQELKETQSLIDDWGTPESVKLKHSQKCACIRREINKLSEARQAQKVKMRGVA